jgi:hypothetical protein
MAIRKILLPLQLTAAAATSSMAVIVARLWRAHLAVLHAAASRDRESAVHDLFERLTAEHGRVSGIAPLQRHVARLGPSADGGRVFMITGIGVHDGTV